jgi:hypothetical protein
MARVAETLSIARNARSEKLVVSQLGKKLRKISEQIAASGEKLLTRRELERELAYRRGGFRAD